MIKEFVRYELAVKLKELGFDEKCFCNWEESWSPEPEHEIRMVLTTDQTWLRPGWVRAPTFSQAFRWFREKYDYDGYFFSNTSYRCRVVIKKIYTMENLVDIMTDTYEEAEIACLEKLIEIVETKQQEQ
jgi:hypothetical protein